MLQGKRHCGLETLSPTVSDVSLHKKKNPKRFHNSGNFLIDVFLRTPEYSISVPPLYFVIRRRQNNLHLSGSSVTACWIQLDFIQAVIFSDLELKMIVRENKPTSSRARFVKVQLCGLCVKDDATGKCL